MIRRPPRSTLSSSSAASDVYKRQSEGRSVPKPPTPTRGILHRNQANQEFVHHARAASGLLTPMTMDHSSFSIVNPHNVGKDDAARCSVFGVCVPEDIVRLSLIHISEPTRLLSISYAVFCLKKKKKKKLKIIEAILFFNIHTKKKKQV
eukprot:TRINITY_DN15368_c0_g2_i8.p1 TRINITY_DN15368_c0_g2~~TRINITY_DN15368_c0_g2_i8.p1  ORF type:complete len:149 (-),score=25.34 TRINITY_DN15368_c0_g2_i8:60-506(-)